jgi:deoxyribose-phosphate aldolase
MNIEEIAAEVTRELLSELYLGQASQSPAVPYSRVLIVFSRSDLDLQPVLTKLGQWKSRAHLQLMAPKWAQGLWSNAPFAAQGLEITFVSPEARAGQAKALLDSVDRLAIVGANRTLLQQISRLNRESLASALVVEALSRSKTALLLDDFLLETEVALSKKLTTLGLKLGRISDLEHIFPLPPVPVSLGQSPALSSGNASIGLPANCQGCEMQGSCASACTDRVRSLVQAGAQRVASSLGMHPVPTDLAPLIDHTLLKAEATESQVRQLCAEAKQYTFASVCVNPTWVSLAAQLLKGTPVKVCTVIGFPLGATDTKTKADETKNAVANGAQEIDMVLNIGAIKSGKEKQVEEDIRAVVQAAAGNTVKVIFETALLSDSEKVLACQLSEKAGAHFVKTSTGFSTGGATEQDVALMRKTIRPDMEVKASGSIRDRETAIKMVQAGATRIGASASIAIVTGTKATGGGKY